MQETNLFLQMIEKCRQGLSKEGKEKKTVIASLEHIAAKLQNRSSAPLPTSLWPIVDLSGIKHVPHPGSPAIDFMKARIYPGPLALISNKISEIETLGLVEKGTDGDRLSVNHTKNLISSIRAHVSISTEAGGRILTSTILTHVVSNLSRNGVDVGIVPSFQMEASKFEYAATGYGDIIDFQIVRGQPDAIKFILCDPKLAFANPEMVKYLSSIVYQAKSERFKDSLPQVAMAAVSYVRQYNLSTFRACVTDGEVWVFLVFNVDDSREGGTIGISERFHLKADLSGLPFVLGLLSDWVSDREVSWLESSNLKSM